QDDINYNVVYLVENRFVWFELNHHGFGENLSRAGLRRHLGQGVGSESRLGEIAHVLVGFGHGGEDAGGFDLGGGHAVGDRAEGFVNRGSAVPDDFEIGRVKRIEEEFRVFTVVGKMRVTFGNTTVFADHVF